MGPMREARNAGRYSARMAQAIRIAAEALIARGSLGLTQDRNDFPQEVFGTQRQLRWRVLTRKE